MGRDQALQRDIMEIMLENGRESSSTLEKKFENGKSHLTGEKYRTRDRQTIRDALADSSGPKKFEVVLEKESAKGKNEKFYSCTTFGVNWFLDREKPPAQYFWDVLFKIGNSELQHYFRPKRKGESIEKNQGQSAIIQLDRTCGLCIGEIISHYERVMLGISREYFCGNAALDDLYFIGKIQHEQQDLFLNIAKILDKLLDDKRNLTRNKIRNTIKSITNDVKFFDKQIINLNYFLNKKEDDRYEIALNGILLLFLYYENHIWINYMDKILNIKNSTDYRDDDKIRDKIELITITYDDYFPNIFPMWKYMRQIIRKIYKNERSKVSYPIDHILLSCLVDQYKNGKEESENNMYKEDSLLPIVNLLHMEKVLHHKFYHEYEHIKKSFLEWVESNRIPAQVIFQHEYEPTKYMSNLINYPTTKFIHFLDEITPNKEQSDLIIKYLSPIQQFFELGYLLLGSTRRVFQKELPMYNSLLKRLENRISFCFFIILRTKIDEENWNAILSKDPNIRKWFLDWIELISNFEKNNLEFIESIQKKSSLQIVSHINNLKNFPIL